MPYYSDTDALASHFDGANNSTTFTDTRGNTLVANGAPKISTTQYAPLTGNTASLRLDGSSYLTVAPNAALNNFGTGDFTIEFWFRADSVATKQSLIECRNTQFAYEIFINSGKLWFYGGAAFNIYMSSGATLTAATWCHVSISRVSLVTRLFLNGILAASDSSGPVPIADATAYLCLGKKYLFADPFAGYLDDLEIIKGSDRPRTENFSVPTAPFTTAPVVSLPSSPCIGATGHAAIWIPVVRVNGADVSSQTIGEIRVEADEGAARIAEFTLKPPTGTVLDLAGWTGRSVEIDVADNSTGSPTNAARLFTGIIDTPALDLAARTLALRCTDDLQGRCDALTIAQLATLIGGYTSPAVFDSAAAGWRYAQDRLTTVPAALDISPAGVLRLTPWAPKTTADFLLDENLLGDGSIAPQIADRAGLTNDVLIEFGYRFPRIKAECHAVAFDWITVSNFAQSMIDSKSFMQRAQVEAAISKAGGTIKSIAYVDLPSTIIDLGGGAFWTPGPYDSTLCMGFTAGVTYDYTQTTEEQHQIHVSNAASITAIGQQQTTLSGALEGVYPDLTATENNIRLYKGEISSIPPTDIAPALEAKTNAVEATLTPETNRAAANAAMQTLIAMAKTRILASHRRNRINATVPLVATLDLDKTIRINADGVLAQGKCVAVTHRINSAAGTAESDFSIALCALSGVGVTHPEDPTSAPAGTVAGNTALAATPTVTFNGAYGADRVITVTFPAVTSANRDNAVSIINTTIAAPINEDLFTVTL